MNQLYITTANFAGESRLDIQKRLHMRMCNLAELARHNIYYRQGD